MKWSGGWLFCLQPIVRFGPVQSGYKWKQHHWSTPQTLYLGKDIVNFAASAALSKQVLSAALDPGGSYYFTLEPSPHQTISTLSVFLMHSHLQVMAIFASSRPWFLNMLCISCMQCPGFWIGHNCSRWHYFYKQEDGASWTPDVNTWQ